MSFRAKLAAKQKMSPQKSDGIPNPPVVNSPPIKKPIIKEETEKRNTEQKQRNTDTKPRNTKKKSPNPKKVKDPSMALLGESLFILKNLTHYKFLANKPQGNAIRELATKIEKYVYE